MSLSAILLLLAFYLGFLNLSPMCVKRIQIIDIRSTHCKTLLAFWNHKVNDPWTVATGWLIGPDFLVTARHFSYDWHYNFGHAKAVKACVGYNGQGSIGTSSVQFRQGRKVAATAEWLKGPSLNHDVSFIMLDPPFSSTVPHNMPTRPCKGVWK